MTTSSAIDELCRSCRGLRCEDCGQTGLEPQPVWLILDGTGELAARASGVKEADEKLACLIDYWREAAACGHPSAPAFAMEREDGARIARVRAKEAAELYDDEVGYLDREP